MNRNKKLGFLGLTAAIIAFSVVYGIGGTGQAPAVSPQRAAFIEADYAQQRDPYFCGQASIQMVLQMIQGKYVSQFRLHNEMNFIPGAGTRNIYMVGPFMNRDIEIIRNGPFSSQEHLRKSIEKGQYSIINIRFDTESRSAHYVLVTGFNETGFFVNDPWPEEWGEAIGRQVGEHVYISNELLQRLWAYRLNWVLTVAEQRIGNATLNMVESGL